MVRHRPAGPGSLRGLLISVLMAALVACTSDADGAADGRDDRPPADGGDVDRVPGVVVQPAAAALSPDGARIVVPCLDDLCVWSTDDGSLESRSGGGDVVAWSPLGDLLATDGFDQDTATVELLDPGTGETVRTLAGHDLDAAQDAATTGISDVSFSPDGTTLASAGDDGAVRLWSVSDGELLLKLATQSPTPRGIAFDPSGGRLAVSAGDAPVEIWNLSSGTLAGTLDAEPQGEVVWSPDGRVLATATNAASTDATVRLWDAQALDERARFNEPVLADRLAFSPDGSTLAMSLKKDPEILLWSVSGGDVRRLAGREETMRTVLWTPDGTTLYAVAARAGVLGWEVRTGELLDPFELAGE